MIKTYALLLATVFGFSQAIFGQSNIRFQPLLNGNLVELNDTKNDIIISKLKFYISQVEFLKDNQTVWKENESYHLLDAENPTSFIIETKSPNKLSFNQLKFTLGIDSLTHEAGVMGGDLDPTKGMYWSWQSGYVNLKIEGQSAISQTQNEEFQFHIGGYKNGYSSAQRISLNVQPEPIITIYFELGEIMNHALQENKTHIMSPGQISQRLSRIAASNFTTNVK